MVFGVVSFQSFLILLLSFFGQSSAYWPGYLCGGIGILLGLFAAYLTLSTKIIQHVGWASLLSASLSSFLVIIVLMMQTKPERVEQFFLPSSIEEMGFAHKVILGSSTLGAFFGIWGLISGIKSRRVAAMLVGGGFAFPCVCHLLAVGLRLISNSVY